MGTETIELCVHGEPSNTKGLHLASALASGRSPGDSKQKHLSEKRKGRCGPLAQRELAEKQEDKIWDGVMCNLEYLLDGM